MGPDTPPQQESQLDQMQNGNSHIAEDLASAVNSDNAKLKSRSNPNRTDKKDLKIVPPIKPRRKKTYTQQAKQFALQSGRSLYAVCEQNHRTAATILFVGILSCFVVPLLYFTY